MFSTWCPDINIIYTARERPEVDKQNQRGRIFVSPIQGVANPPGPTSSVGDPLHFGADPDPRIRTSD
jgi:hypothetical protein